MTVDEKICQASSRLNNALAGKPDRVRFLKEADRLDDILADRLPAQRLEGGNDVLSAAALAVQRAAPDTFDGPAEHRRTLDAVQGLNDACLQADV